MTITKSLTKGNLISCFHFAAGAIESGGEASWHRNALLPGLSEDPRS